MSAPTTTYNDERDYPKVEKYTGLKANWNIWSGMTLSVFQRKGLSLLIDHLDRAEEVPKDSDDCLDTASPQAPIEEKVKYKEQNTRAFALLLTSIDYTTVPGAECWERVKNHKSADYKHGNFKTAWLELKALNEKVDLKEKRKVTAAYHERKLGIKEHPSTFLTELKKL